MSFEKKNSSEVFFFENIHKQSAIDVVAIFARDLSCSAVVQAQICAEFSTKRPQHADINSEQDAFVAQMLEMLTNRVMFEVVASPTNKQDYTFTLYLFGRDKPLFSFSYLCLQTNPTLTQCLNLMISSGYERQGETFFNSRHVPRDSSRIEYVDFKYNDVFSRHFLRSGLIVHLFTVCASGIDIFLADKFPDTTFAGVATALLNSISEDLDSKLTQFIVTNGSSAPWITQDVRDIVKRLSTEKKTAADVKKLFSIAIAKHARSYPLINNMK
jgi:hypothetical protein